MILTWCTELAALVLEYWVMAELAEQVDLRTLASARDFSMAHFVIWNWEFMFHCHNYLSLDVKPWTLCETFQKGHGSFKNTEAC